MRIAVYTIALNEEKVVDRWFESCKDADVLLVADTGSTDKTIELLRERGVTVVSIKVDPWRFDVARNAALAHLPEDVDVCVSLDMDEYLDWGWRRALESTWKPETGRAFYQYYFAGRYGRSSTLGRDTGGLGLYTRTSLG
jgi:glycosyltransferase involved in cell wall biosynthesis